jgi:hypothetical protein
MRTTFISTTDGRWHTVEWDDAAASWREVASGPVLVEPAVEAPERNCAYLPYDRPRMLLPGRRAGKLCGASRRRHEADR